MPRAEFVSTRTLLEKLGVKAGAKVLLVGVSEEDFVNQLRSIQAELHDSETGTGFDAIFFRVESRAHLARLRELRELIKPNGTIWLLRRKGKGATLRESETMAAGKDAGLVDVKVVNFSETESAEKFVIPVALRGGS
jgi:hypothetical protein